MKKTLKHILGLVIILPFLFTSCQKSEVEKESDNSFETGKLKSTTEYCGDPYVANLVDWNQTINPGTLTIANDENLLYATFEVAPGYELETTALYVGPESEIPRDWLDPSTHTGQFHPGQFPYETIHDPMLSTFTITIDLSLLDDCFAVVGIAKVYNTATSELKVVSAISNLKALGYYFDYCKQECGVPVYDCETAFAYGEDYATCFLDIPAIKNNRWGWTNEIGEGTYSWPIYAGAGQCDISKGTLVGTLDVEYSGGTATVTYNIDADFTLEETHLYVGSDILPKKKNKYTTAPGQYPYSGGSSFTIDGLSGDIYIVAHSVVCGDYGD